MKAHKILFTTPTFPYPTLPNDTSLTDPTGARFTRADGVFGLLTHTHNFASHILAQNIDVPSVILEYPRWEDFTTEVDKDYPVIAISALPVHLDTVLKMCDYVRENWPNTKILLGSYAGMAMQACYDEETQKRYVDEICHGEGVSFLRAYLGEPTDRPVRQMLMPKAGGAPPFISRFPAGTVAFLVSGLGCPGRCDFCSSTALYDHKRIEMLSPTELVEHMVAYHQHYPNVSHVFIIEEDHFRHPRYLRGLTEPWARHPELAESLDWFAFGSVDNIGAFADRYGWEAIAETGIGVVFIGVESKFGDKLQSNKRSRYDPRVVFENLHNMGIRTIGSWVSGWDFHDHSNIEEDLNYFISLCPTYQQLTRLSPFPGTPLYSQLKAEGRVQDGPWEDTHFWSGAQKNLGLEDHETLNLVEQGYKLMHETWGPSLLRRLDVLIQGYTFCRQSKNPLLRDHRALFLKKQAGLIWALLPAMQRFAPNGVVRRRARRTDQSFRAVIGEPTPVMKVLAKTVLALATVERGRMVIDPSWPGPKEEPFKRYTFDKDPARDGLMPYRTEWPSRPKRAIRLAMRREEWRYAALEKALKVTQFGAGTKGCALIDEHLIELVSSRSFGFGL
jgi:hypothetical protein